MTSSIATDLLTRATALTAQTSKTKLWIQGAPLNALSAYALKKSKQPGDAWSSLATMAFEARLKMTDWSENFFFDTVALGPSATIAPPDIDHPAQAWHQLDQELLTSLSNQGFLTHHPHLTTAMGSSQRVGVVGGRAMWTAPNHPGFVVLQTDRSGAIAVMSNDDEHHTKVFSRWFTLLHECAHLEWARQPEVFTPTPDNALAPHLTDEVVDRLRRWSLKPAAMSFPAQFLSEGFAESYGMMMLLTQQNFSEKALDFAQNNLLFRQQALHDKHPSPHVACALALFKCLENIDEWKDLSPEKMREKALQYASNAYVEWGNPLDAAALDPATHMSERGLKLSLWTPQSLPLNRASLGAHEAIIKGHVTSVDQMTPFWGNATWKPFNEKIVTIGQNIIQQELVAKSLTFPLDEVKDREKIKEVLSILNLAQKKAINVLQKQDEKFFGWQHRDQHICQENELDNFERLVSSDPPSHQMYQRFVQAFLNHPDMPEAFFAHQNAWKQFEQDAKAQSDWVEKTIQAQRLELRSSSPSLRDRLDAQRTAKNQSENTPIDHHAVRKSLLR